MNISGRLKKMTVTAGPLAQYAISTDNDQLPINDALGKRLSIHFNQVITCNHCKKVTRKSFSQGYCYTCFTTLAQCDSCIMSPEKCHLQMGTCREPEWGQRYCETDHIVYLANTSGLKIGITRANQLPTRWFDQGATEALPLFRVETRRLSGLIENHCKSFLADKTNWRAMLKGDGVKIDLVQEAQQVQEKIADYIDNLQMAFGVQAITILENAPLWSTEYPVRNYPIKVQSLSLDKQATVEGVLEGIKGQYLILDTGVINLRKFTGYQVSVSVKEA